MLYVKKTVSHVFYKTVTFSTAMAAMSQASTATPQKTNTPFIIDVGGAYLNLASALNINSL